MQMEAFKDLVTFAILHYIANNAAMKLLSGLGV